MDAAALTELDEDLRHLAAEAVNTAHRPSSGAGVQFVAPALEEPFVMPARRRKWMTAGAAAIVVALVASVVLLLRGRSPKPAPSAAPPALATQPPAEAPQPAAPVAAPAAPAPPEVVHETASPRQKKQRSVAKKSGSKTASAKKAASAKKPVNVKKPAKAKKP
jgi:hypothetical protein